MPCWISVRCCFLYIAGMLPTPAWQAEYWRYCEAVLQARTTSSHRAACEAATHVVFLLYAQHVLPPQLPDRRSKGETLNDRFCLRRTGLISHVCLTMQNHTSSTLYSRFPVSSEEERFAKAVKKHGMDDTPYVNNPTVISTILVISSD